MVQYLIWRVMKFFKDLSNSLKSEEVPVELGEFSSDVRADKDPADYSEQLESMVQDFNELNEVYKSACKLLDVYQKSLTDLQLTNSILLSMNADLTKILKSTRDYGVPESDNGS
mgnify:CR=1 FL=1